MLMGRNGMNTKKNADPPQRKTRDKLGRFAPGNKSSKGAGGRPSLRDEFKKFAQEKSFEALQVVYGIMTGTDTNQRDRTAAARLLMEYGYGRPSAEYDRERLDIDRRLADARIAQIQREETDGPQQVEVIISNQAKEWGK